PAWKNLRSRRLSLRLWPRFWPRTLWCEQVPARLVSAGIGSAEHEIAKTVDKVRSETVVPYEEAHVDGSVERIEEQVQVDVAAQFAAQNPAPQCSVCLLPGRQEERSAERGDE